MPYSQMAFGEQGDLVKLKADTESAIQGLGSFRKELTLSISLTRALSGMLLGLGLPPDVRKNLVILRNFMRAVQMLRHEWMLFKASLGPIGLALMVATALGQAMETSAMVAEIDFETSEQLRMESETR